MDPEEIRLEALRMAFDMLASHREPFNVMDALTVADALLNYVCTGNFPVRAEQPTVN